MEDWERFLIPFSALCLSQRSTFNLMYLPKWDAPGSDATGMGVGVGVCSDTTGLLVGLAATLGDGDVATVVVSLQPTKSAISNPGIAKFSFMFKIYLYV